jgi:hypothetical protein
MTKKTETTKPPAQGYVSSAANDRFYGGLVLYDRP